jgi:hypothetical protein
MRVRKGLKRDEVVGGWRKLHNEELHSSHIKVIESRRMRWVVHVAVTDAHH